MLLSKLPANLIAKERIKSFAAFSFEEIAYTRNGSRASAGFRAFAMSLSKKTLLAMLVGATLTSLYGCGGDDSGGGGDNMPPADEAAPEGTYDGYKCIRFEEDPENLTPEWCANHGPPVYWSRGVDDNAKFPGCQECWCCEGVGGTTVGPAGGAAAATTASP